MSDRAHLSRAPEAEVKREETSDEALPSTRRVMGHLLRCTVVGAALCGSLGMFMNGLAGMVVGAVCGFAVGFFLMPVVLLFGLAADTGKAAHRVLHRRQVIKTQQRDRRAGLLSMSVHPEEGALSAAPDVGAVSPVSPESDDDPPGRRADRP